jgi:hypothetical protein
VSARAKAAVLLVLLAWLVASAEWPLWTLLIALALCAQGARMAWVDLVEYGVRGGSEVSR